MNLCWTLKKHIYIAESLCYQCRVLACTILSWLNKIVYFTHSDCFRVLNFFLIWARLIVDRKLFRCDICRFISVGSTVLTLKNVHEFHGFYFQKRPPDNSFYIKTCSKNPKKTKWWYHGEYTNPLIFFYWLNPHSVAIVIQRRMLMKWYIYAWIYTCTMLQLRMLLRFNVYSVVVMSVTKLLQWMLSH